MSHTPKKPNYPRMILNHLANPIELRLSLCVAIITAWFFLFFSPLSQQIADTTSRIDSERKRIAIAREIEQLRKAEAPVRSLIPIGADVNEMMRHVIGQLRSSPLKLTDLRPEKTKDLGAFQTIGLHLQLEGRFSELDAFLRWVETDKRLSRIDSIKLAPDAKSPGVLKADLTLINLVEKAADSAKAKPESSADASKAKVDESNSGPKSKEKVRVDAAKPKSKRIEKSAAIAKLKLNSGKPR